MKTVLTGTHQPEKSAQPKRSRRSPKKRRTEKSEVATPEFGTISSAKPSHGESTKTVTGVIRESRREYPLAEEASVYVAHKEYQRELGKARSRKQQWIERERTNAMRAGFAVGSVLGLIVGLGVWWLSVLFS
jgi:hypothetical protein